MADIYDVEQALVALATQAVYPNGTSMPSVANCNVILSPGWPVPGTLDSDLNAGNAMVTVFPTNIAKATTRFAANWQQTALTEATLTLTVTNNVVTVGGVVTIPQACMVFVNNISYSYGVQSNDTLASIATALASLIPNASAIGPAITISNNPYNIIGRVIITGSVTRELAREKRMMYVSVWAPTPLIRSQLASAIQVLFAATYRLPLPDGYDGQLSFEGFIEKDQAERQNLFERHLHFLFEYAITQTQTAYTVGANIINTQLQPTPLQQ